MNSVLLLPTAVIMVVSFLWPVTTILLRSLNKGGKASLSGLYFGHYRSLFGDSVLRGIAEQTLWLAAVSTGVTVLLAFPVAYLASRSSRRLATILVYLVLIPFWVSVLVRLFAFTTILGRRGLVNSFLGLFDVGPLALLFNSTATVIGMVAYLLPYMVLILYAAMSSVDNSLVTAAKTMGASGRQAFFQIYLPQIRPALISGVLLIFVLALGFFLTPALLGGPSDITLPVYIQQQINLFAWGRASAAGILLLAVSLIGYVIALRISGLGVLNMGGRPVNRGGAAQEPLRFGFSTMSAWALTGVAMLLLIGPLLVVIPAAFTTSSAIGFPADGLTLKWFENVLTDELWTGAIAKSARVAATVAVVTTLIALAGARAYCQIKRSSVRLAVQTVAFAPLIVPVILLAIGVFDVQARLGWLGTDFGLAVAHTVLAYPFAFLVLSNSMSRLDSSLEEAAWSMGVSRNRTFWTVVVPNIIPAIVGAMVISFMTSWDEAVIALFQGEIDKTLPVTIYSLLKSGVTPAVAAVAVLLIIPVVAVMIAYVVFSGRRAKAQSGEVKA